MQGVCGIHSVGSAALPENSFTESDVSGSVVVLPGNREVKEVPILGTGM